MIEIMVATSIFMVIMLVAMGALITSSDTAKKAQALRSAMDNVNFAMESMTRSLRMGTDYTCVTFGSSVSLPASANADCPFSMGGGGAVVFTPAEAPTKRDAAFRVVPRQDGSVTNVLQRCMPECVDLVSSDVDIQKLVFYVSGSDPLDKIQPSVYIAIKGSVTVKGEANTFAIQTMTSQRTVE